MTPIRIASMGPHSGECGKYRFEAWNAPHEYGFNGAALR